MIFEWSNTLENWLAELGSYHTNSGKGLICEKCRENKEVLINWIIYLWCVILPALLLHSEDRTE